MNVDRSAALLHAVVVCVTISRSTDKENTMDEDDAEAEPSRATTSSPLFRQRSRSASIDHFSTVSTEHMNEASDHRKQRYHIASFDFNYVSEPFIKSLWIVLSTVAKIGLLITGYVAWVIDTYSLTNFVMDIINVIIKKEQI